jgi:hypothetical protein
MNHRYRAALALTLAAALLAAAPSPHPRPRPVSPPAAEELYSRRALRRAKIILQLKLLELREQQLDRVRRAVEKTLRQHP